MAQPEVSEYRAHYMRRKMGDAGGKDGTQLAGFVTAAQNRPPRECGSCRHQIDHYCQHPVVNADPELGKRREPEGIAVDSDSCCDYFQNEQSGM